MLKYKVGQRVVTYTGFRGKIKRIDVDAERPCIVRKDSGHHWEYSEDELVLEVSPSNCIDLQAENERLKAALRKIAGYWSDNSVKPMSDADSIDYLISVALAAILESEQPS